VATLLDAHDDGIHWIVRLDPEVPAIPAAAAATPPEGECFMLPPETFAADPGEVPGPIEGGEEEATLRRDTGWRLLLMEVPTQCVVLPCCVVHTERHAL